MIFIFFPPDLAQASCESSAAGFSCSKPVIAIAGASLPKMTSDCYCTIPIKTEHTTLLFQTLYKGWSTFDDNDTALQ